MALTLKKALHQIKRQIIPLKSTYRYFWCKTSSSSRHSLWILKSSLDCQTYDYAMNQTSKYPNESCTIMPGLLFSPNSWQLVIVNKLDVCSHLERTWSWVSTRTVKTGRSWQSSSDTPAPSLGRRWQVWRTMWQGWRRTRLASTTSLERARRPSRTLPSSRSWRRRALRYVFLALLIFSDILLMILFILEALVKLEFVTFWLWYLIWKHSSTLSLSSSAFDSLLGFSYPELFVNSFCWSQVAECSPICVSDLWQPKLTGL